MSQCNFFLDHIELDSPLAPAACPRANATLECAAAADCAADAIDTAVWLIMKASSREEVSTTIGLATLKYWSVTAMVFFMVARGK